MQALREHVSSVEAFPIGQEHSRTRFLKDHLQSTVGRVVYTRPTYEDKLVHRRIRTLVRNNKYSIAHVDSLDLAAYLPDVSGIPTVLVHHNIESQLLRRRADRTENPVVSSYLRFQAELMEKEERMFAPTVSINITCSQDDKDLLANIARTAAATVVPNGVDVEYFRPREVSGRTGVISVGGMTWFPNKDAVEYFAASILPDVHKSTPGVVVDWVGRASDAEIARLRADGISMTGYVDDIRPYLDRRACFVAPLRVGGGTRLKLLDAWAMGKAIVSTSVGCEGLNVIDGENMLVRDDPKGFADAVVEVLSDHILRRQLEIQARSTAEETYSWEVIGRSMLKLYADTMQ